MKSYFELAKRHNPLVATYFGLSYYRVNKAWGVSWYLSNSSRDTIAKLIGKGTFIELEPTYRDGSHKYWRRFK